MTIEWAFASGGRGIYHGRIIWNGCGAGIAGRNSQAVRNTAF